MTKKKRIVPVVLLGLLSLYPVFRGLPSLSQRGKVGEENVGLPTASRDVVVLVIDFSDRSGNALEKSNLAMMRDLDRRLFDSDWVRSYRGPLNATVVKTDDDDILVVPFINAAVIDPYREGTAQGLIHEYALYAELSPFVSGDFLACAFYIEPGIRLTAQFIVRELDLIQRQMLEDHGLTFEYTGVRPVRASIERYMTQDASRILPLLFVLVSLVYLVGFGNPRVLALAWLTKILVTTTSYACFRLFYDDVSPLIILIPTFNFALLSDYLIHVFYHSSRTADSDDAVSLRRYLIVPLSLTAATSAIGFASLAVFGDPGHVMLAIVVGTSIALTYVLALWWVPSWSLDMHPSGSIQTVRPLGRIRRSLTRRMTAMLIAARRGRTVVLIALGILLVLAASQLPKLQVQPYPVMQLPETSTVVVAEELLVREFAGTVPFTFEIDTGRSGAVLRSDSLLALERIHGVFAGNEEIGFHRSVLSVIERMHYYFNESDPAYLAVPSGLDEELFSQLVEQYLLFYSASASPEEYESFIGADYRTTVVHGILKYREGDSLDRLIETLEAARSVAPPEWSIEIGGVAAALIERKHSLENNWYVSLGIGSVLIFLTVLILYKNVSMAFIGLIPSFAILILITGFSALIGIDIDEYTIIIVAISIGLTIDYTIHILNAIQKTGKASHSVVSFAYSVVRRAGVPILLSLLTTVLAFSTMYLSSFSGAVFFSLLLSLSIIVAFCVGVFVLPVFFMNSVKEKQI
jgi:uncharacterized protein